MKLKMIDKVLFERLTILYVEDDPSTREEVSFFLKRVAGTVHVAKDGQEGLALFENYRFDMVITDIQMPVMNGLDMVKAIRKIDQKVPIAVTTAYSDTDFLIKSIECGVDKYILKPIDMMEMAAVVQKCTNYNFMAQKLDAYDHFTQFILDQNSSFMFIVNDGDLEYANMHLMEMFGIKTFDEIYDKSLFFLEHHKLYKKENWVHYVQSNENREYTVAFGEGTKRYHLEYKQFSNIAKRIFLFKEIESSVPHHDDSPHFVEESVH